MLPGTTLVLAKTLVLATTMRSAASWAAETEKALTQQYTYYEEESRTVSA